MLFQRYITVYAQLSKQILYSYLRVRNATSCVLKQGNTSFGHFMKRNKKQWQEFYNSSRNDWRNIPRTTSLISCRMYLPIMPTCPYCYLLYNCSHRRSCLASRRNPRLVLYEHFCDNDLLCSNCKFVAENIDTFSVQEW